MSDLSDHRAVPGDHNDLHPALLGAVLRFGRIGGHEAAATLVHLIGMGVVEVHTSAVPAQVPAVRGPDLEMDLAAEETRPSHHREGSPVVRQGHVAGLSHLDRAFLSLLFDSVAHADHVTFDQIDAFSHRLPWEYWSDIKAWREIVVREARVKHLLGGEEHRLGWLEVWRLRREVRREIASLRDGRADSCPSNRLMELSVVFGLERQLAKVLSAPSSGTFEDAQQEGSAGLRWLCTPKPGSHAPVVALARAFSPLRVARYEPAQYTRIVLPRWYGGGGPIDDGATRLGG